MKQEQRFVTELYRYLAPFIDPESRIHVSLDGEAAKKGVHEKFFEDPHIPDLWFTFMGAQSQTLLEAKTLFSDNSIKLGQGQLRAWRTSGKGKHKPMAWVAASSDLKKFYYWEHTAFLEKLDKCESGADYPEIWLPDGKQFFDDIRKLALHVLRSAAQVGGSQ